MSTWVLIYLVTFRHLADGGPSLLQMGSIFMGNCSDIYRHHGVRTLSLELSSFFLLTFLLLTQLLLDRLDILVRRCSRCTAYYHCQTSQAFLADKQKSYASYEESPPA